LLFVLSLSACSNIDELSGKTFDVRVVGSPTEPVDFQTIMTLEFTDDNTFKNSKGNEEGTYELNGDKFVILIENEKVEIEFTLEENTKGLSEHSAELTDADYQVEDTEQVSKYREFYHNIQNADSYVILAQK